MKKFRAIACAALFLTSVPLGFCSGVVKVQEIGLQGYYGSGITRVRLQLANPGAAQLELDLRMKVWSRGHSYESGMEDAFTKHASLDAGQSISLDLPILVFATVEPVLTVEARDPAGRIVGEENVGLQSGRSALIAIVCNAPTTCQETQNQIQYAGTDKEQEERSRDTKIIALHDLPLVWWAYTPASFVVLAMPVASMQPAQLSALEGYLRNGGKVVLLEHESSPGDFLRRYPSADATKSLSVGRGVLYRQPGLNSKLLPALFAGTNNIGQGYYEEEYAPWFRRWGRPAWPFTHFDFPRLRWLLLWMVAYTLILGVINFAVLKKIKRLDLGWLTIPIIALCFAVAMYLASSHRQPKIAGLDQGTVDWMDNGSDLAGEQLDIRVSSPKVQLLEVSLPDSPVFAHGTRMFGRTVHINSEDHNSGSDWNVDLGAPERFRLGMLRLSYQDLSFRTLRRLPGTVKKLSATQFVNQTGRNFKQAVFLKGDAIYLLGTVPPGATFDIGKVGSRKRDQNPAPPSRFKKNDQRTELNFEEFATGLVAPTEGGTFVGVSEETASHGSVSGAPFSPRQFTATVVNMSASQ